MCEFVDLIAYNRDGATNLTAGVLFVVVDLVVVVVCVVVAVLAIAIVIMGMSRTIIVNT